MISAAIKKQILQKPNKKFVVTDTSEYTYFDLGKQIYYYNSLFEKYNAKKILIKSNQNFYSYAAILAAYLSNVTFCFLNDEINGERQEVVIKEYMPDLLFSTVDCELENIPIIKMDVTSEIIDYCFNNELRYNGKQDIAYILYTSGSTGFPKGCIIRRESIEVFIEKACNIFKFKEDDIYGQYPPLFFDMSMLDVFVAPVNGLCIVPFCSKSDKLKPARLIEKFGITFINCVPQAFNLIDRFKQLNNDYCSTLRMIKFGGDKVEALMIEKIFKSLNVDKIFVTYGPTEATVFCMLEELDRSSWKNSVDHIVSLGSEIPGYSEILIQDDEIIVSGPCVSSGYLNGISDKFYENKGKRYYKTGDFCLEKNGKLFFAGRRDRQLKINGNRIDMSEIENAFHDIAEFAHCINLNNKVVSYIISNNDEENIRNIISKRIPSYMMPSTIKFISSVPLNANGKIDDKQLIKLLEDKYEYIK